MAKITLVDDDENIVASVSLALESLGHKVKGYNDGVSGLAALELNLSCPNVSGGVDFATDPAVTARVVKSVRGVCPLPIIAKLTPNVTSIVPIAQAVDKISQFDPNLTSVDPVQRC